MSLPFSQKEDFPSFRGQTCGMDLCRPQATNSPVVEYFFDVNLPSKSSLPEVGNPPNPPFAKGGYPSPGRGLDNKKTLALIATL